jgi:glycosyltransferase involved in cell wall biosynthesis
MARIAFCANTSWNITNFRMPIIDALLARGDEVLVVAGPDDSEVQLRKKGCKVFSLSVDAKGTSPLHDLALMFKLQRLYARQRPDVILNFTIKPVIYGTLSAKSISIPVINTITGLGTAFIRNTWLTRVVHNLYRSTLPGAQPVVFQNEEDLALFRERGLVTKNPITIVPGSGVDLTRFRPTSMPQGVPITFLFIGRLIKDKGIKELVAAARVVRTTYPHARFQLLGSLGAANRTAISAEDISRWVNEGVIEYLGSTGDVRPYVEQAHCVVLPSYREGMPRVLLEAAAMGRPLIATDVAGCRDVVRHGVNGYLCVPHEAADLASKMRNFIDLSFSERQEMGAASRAMADERFDVSKVVDTYLGLIDVELARIGRTTDNRFIKQAISGKTIIPTIK